jgi:hypothetical protein
MGKLEETFNIPDTIEQIEEKANQISEAFSDDPDTDLDILVQAYTKSTQLDFVDMNDMAKYDREMDEVSEKTLQEFEDLMILGKDVETRHAGEIFSAAAQMAKLTLDARTNKMNAKLKMAELAIRKKRNDLLEQKQNGSKEDEDDITGEVLDRDALLQVAEEYKKSQKP